MRIFKIIFNSFLFVHETATFRLGAAIHLLFISRKKLFLPSYWVRHIQQSFTAVFQMP